MTERPGPVRAGLWLLAGCSVLDIASLAASDGKNPPWAVAIVGAAIGAASLWLAIKALRDTGSGVRLLAALRIISALSAVPAFVVSDVPAGIVALAAAIVVLNVLGVVMIAGVGRRVEMSR